MSTQTSITKFLERVSTPEYIDDLVKETTRNRKAVTNITLTHDILTQFPNADIKGTSIRNSIKGFTVEAFRNLPGTTIARAILHALNLWIPALYQDDRAPSQQKLMAEIRKILLTYYDPFHKIVRMSYSTLKFDQTILAKIRKAYVKSVSDRNQDKLIFDDVDIYKILDMCAAGSDDWRLNAIGLELAIGSRINEILSVAEFFEVEDKPNWIRQKGLSKQTAEFKDRCVTKPIIRLTFSQVNHMVKSVRSALGMLSWNRDAYEVSQAALQTINKKISELFSAYDFKVTTHKLRAIYAVLSYRLFADMHIISEQAWCSNVLGHAPDSISTASSYTTVSVRILDNNDEALNEIIKLRAQVKALTEEIKNPVAKKTDPDAIPDDVPKNPKLRDGKTLERLYDSVRIMKIKDMEITRPALRDLCYGSACINQFFKKECALGNYL